MLAVPLDLLARVAVEDQADRELESEIVLHALTNLVVFPHFVGNVITVLQLVDKSITSVVDQQTADTSQCFSSEEFDFCIGVFGVDQACWVDLDLFEIDTLGAHNHGHLVAITGTVVTVCSGLLSGQSLYTNSRDHSIRVDAS